eukprot:8503066-Pyramimonas_sp.AAC.2
MCLNGCICNCTCTGLLLSVSPAIRCGCVGNGCDFGAWWARELPSRAGVSAMSGAAVPSL